MKHFLPILVLVCSTRLCAQTTDLKLPDFLPPTPDVGAIIKNGNMAANPHSGAASVAIPIYTLKVRDFALPVSLSYATSGFKPDEIPSRVGIGWSLNAGGVISRIVRGKPDDGTTTPTPLPISEFTSWTNNLMTYLTAVSDPTSSFDTQPDEYRFNVNGISGKFFILRDGSVLSIPFSNNKVLVNKTNNSVTSVTIIDEKGVTYIFSAFGNTTEKTLNHSMANGNLRSTSIKTSWFLTKIVLPTTEFIDFIYNPITIQTIIGKTSVVKLDIRTNSPCESELPCPFGIGYSNSVSQATYQTFYLKEIKGSTGTSVKFNYEPRPDNSGDVRLKSIDVWNDFVTHQIKKVDLTFQNQGQDQLHRRFFLKEVSFTNPLNVLDKQRYLLEYADQDSRPERFSGTTDHMGYSNLNGLASSPDFIQTLSEEEYLADEINKRLPNGTEAEKGTLKKITYPTGGYDEFVYEPNQLSYWDNVRVPEIQNKHVEGVGGSPSATYTSSYFTPSYTQQAEFYASTWYTMPANTPGGESVTAFVRLIRTDNNTIVNQWTLKGYTGFQGFSGNMPNRIQILGGVSYRLEVEVKNGGWNLAKADIVYDVSNTTVFKEIREELCGIRVKKIVSFDPVSNKKIGKYYFYRSFTDTIGLQSASAKKMYFNSYLSNAQRYQQCPEGLGGLQGIYAFMVCESRVFSVNSVNVVEINDAGGVVYTNVIESDDENFANGCVEHKYNYQGEMAAGPVLNGPIPDGPLDAYNYRNGLELQTRFYNSQRQLVRQVVNTYTTDPRLTGKQQLSNFIIRKRYDPDIPYPYTAQSFAHFDVEQYGIYTAWDHLDFTEVTDYDPEKNIALTSKVNYYYSPQLSTTPLHTNVSKVEAKGSDGLITSDIKKYAPDLSSIPSLVALTAKNQITDVIENETWKNNELLVKLKNNFVDASTLNSTIPANTYYVTDKVKQQVGNNPPEDRLRFYKYDAQLNILEASKENDIRLSYIWDYHNKLAIAEVSNGNYEEGIAFSSFEADGNGGWEYNNSSVIDGGFTGNRSFQLSQSRWLQKQNLVPNVNFAYTVSFWAMGGTATVNGISDPPLKTINGWSFYKYDLPADELQKINIAGTAVIDEVRLYPKKALMKSFTYLPEVGVLSVNDANDQMIKYEYDGFNRLIRIRDVDDNILKQVEYNYSEIIPPCPDANANWQTTGNFRCAKNNPFNNANTGLREREEKDFNNCSSTYMQTRWVSVGTASDCPAQVCTGLYNRMVNGVCTPGTRTFIKSRYLGNLQWDCTYEYSWSDGYKWIGTQTQNHYCSSTPQD